MDTLSTHVVSAIINVDQEVTRPWKLLILDHEDQEHELEMTPGDMVLYESAKLLHGRPGHPSPHLSLTIGQNRWMAFATKTFSFTSSLRADGTFFSLPARPSATLEDGRGGAYGS